MAEDWKPIYYRPIGPLDCYCCGHVSSDHSVGPCTAELFNITETILVDCPCGAFIEAVPEEES